MRHKFLTACLCLSLAIALFSGVFAVMGWGSLLSEVGATILYPFQWLVSGVGGAVTGFSQYAADVDALQAENDSLRAELESLRGALIDAEITADENAWLYAYLSIKENRADYTLCNASPIALSTAVAGDYVTELTLNRGTSSGVAEGMPVITSQGLLGVVVEVGSTHCKVSTVLDTSVSVGAITTRGRESGMTEGNYALVHDGQVMLRYLSEEADVAVGDVVITSGRGSVYPYGIPIGRVVAVSANAYSRTTEAMVVPFADLSNIGEVAILTSYVHYVDGFTSPGTAGGTP